MSTTFIPAYDTEIYDAVRPNADVPTCLEACHRIAEVHRQHEVPATFFIVGRALEDHSSQYRELLDDPLFEIASHTYSHKCLRDHPICGPAASLPDAREELLRGKELVEEVFERPCLGVRPGNGFVDGFRGAPELLEIVAEAGYRYISTLLWGPDYTAPAPLTQSFTYEGDGFPAIREFPGHGWQENLLKGSNLAFGPQWGAMRVLLFPPLFPETIPDDYVTTPEEEFRLNNKYFLDKASAEDLTYVTLIWHPWSLALHDPEMRMLELTFEHAHGQGIECCTFADLDERLRRSQAG